MQSKLKKILRLLLFFFPFLAPPTTGFSQQGASGLPEVGKPLPDFTLNDVRLHDSNQLKPGDFKGKWLILDFWNRGCIICIQSFPRLNTLQQKFKKDVRFVLIGDNRLKYNRGIEELYEKLQLQYGLKLTHAFDSLLFERFKIQGVPHIIVVNPEGIVYAITASSEMTEEKISDLIAGKHPTMVNKNGPTDNQEKVIMNRPFYLDENIGEDEDFEFRSIFGKWRPGSGVNVYLNFDKYVEVGYFSAAGVKLEWLYKFAYFGHNIWYADHPLYGKISREIVFELQDTSLFIPDASTGRGLYNYQLIVPPNKADKTFMMEVMQRDLKNYFGYQVDVESREMPCWELLVIPGMEDSLRTKYEEYEWNGDWLGLEAKYITVSDLIYALNYFSPTEVFLDYTEINFPIDIHIDAVMTDFSLVKAALKRAGIDLVRSTHKIDVITIRDP